MADDAVGRGDRGWLRRARSVCCGACVSPAAFTVEPAVLLFCLASGLAGPTSAALWYRKVCDARFDVTTCAHLSNASFSAQELAVQRDASRWLFYEKLCYSLPAVVLTVVYGSWSDRFSRRLPLLLPAVGALLNAANYMLSAAFVNSPVVVLLLGQLLMGFFGSTLTMLMGAFSYLADVCPPESRTLRIALVEATFLVANAVAHFASGALLDATSFALVYAICMMLYGAVIAYCLLRLKAHPSATANVSNGHVQAVTSEKDTSRKTRISVRQLVSLRHIKDVFRVIVAKRQQNRRKYIILLIISVFFYILGMGESQNCRVTNYVKNYVSQIRTCFHSRTNNYNVVCKPALLTIWGPVNNRVHTSNSLNTVGYFN